MNDRLDIFLQGVASAAHLLNKAIANRSALEALVLIATIVDSNLRIGIVLRKQLKNDTKEVDESLLHQKKGDRKLNERQIMRLALADGVIGKTLHDKLSALYDKRNKCIHRYVISDINYNYVSQLFLEYMSAHDELTKVIYDIEEEQIRLGKGMTVNGPDCPASLIRQMAYEKLSRPPVDG